MARANRHFLSGYVWHITHRCHRKAFLLKFARDRRRWLYWLCQAKLRFGLCVLNYTVTCNHIHLLVHDAGRGEIARSMQLVAGRTAQEFNRRKGRRGAFWEDRYHATAVQTDEHLGRCMAYIDLNMVRAGVVTHPSTWIHGGYREIQNPPQRYGAISIPMLMKLLGVGDPNALAAKCKHSVGSELRNDATKREAQWTESVAVGSELFVSDVKNGLGAKGIGRAIVSSGSVTMLREPKIPYDCNFEAEIGALTPNVG